MAALSGANRRASTVRAGAGHKTHLPVVVLVDRESASAAEVLAAALHDHHRATVVGEPTYGKSLVQEIDRLATGGALKLTVASHRTPAGRDIAHGGVAPDVRTTHALTRAVTLLSRS